MSCAFLSPYFDQALINGFEPQYGAASFAVAGTFTQVSSACTAYPTITPTATIYGSGGFPQAPISTVTCAPIRIDQSVTNPTGIIICPLAQSVLSDKGLLFLDLNPLQNQIALDITLGPSSSGAVSTITQTEVFYTRSSDIPGNTVTTTICSGSTITTSTATTTSTRTATVSSTYTCSTKTTSSTSVRTPTSSTRASSPSSSATTGILTSTSPTSTSRSTPITSSVTSTTISTTKTPSSVPSCTNGSTNYSPCTVECNMDRPGGDYAAVRVSSFADCASTCNKDSKCIAAQYRKDNSFCYLKNVLTSAVDNVNVDSINCQRQKQNSITAKSSTATTGRVNRRGLLTARATFVPYTTTISGVPYGGPQYLIARTTSTTTVTYRTTQTSSATTNTALTTTLTTTDRGCTSTTTRIVTSSKEATTIKTSTIIVGNCAAST